MDTQLNPWKSIWTNPRGTIRSIVETDPNHQLLVFVIFGGIAHALSYASAAGLGEAFKLSELIGLVALVGPLSGFVSLWLGSWLLTLITQRLGGAAPKEHNRAALAWSWAPMIYLLPLWGIKYILFRKELFLTDRSYLQSEPLLNGIWVVLDVVDFGIAIWSLIILFSALSEVNRFELWRGVVAYLIMSLLLLLPVMLLLMAGLA